MSLLDDYHNAPGKLRQSQRKAARDQQDKLDSIACAEEADHHCDLCMRHAPYKPNDRTSGSMHHGRRKATKEIRHNRDFHFWLCWHCHEECHGSDPRSVNQSIESVIQMRTG